MAHSAAPPTDTVDLFCDDVLRDPYPHFKRLRDAGPAVYLTGLDMWFLGRYETTRSVLVDWRAFSSAQGVGMTDKFNAAMSAALICLDPPEHTPQRTLFTDSLAPKALRPVEEIIDQRARDLVTDLKAREQVDAVLDLAHDLPVNVIMDLVGWPHQIRDQLIPMAKAWFNTIGPMNGHSAESWPLVGQMIELVTSSAQAGNLAEGSFGHHLLEAHKAGHLPFDAVVGLLEGYVVAAFDTTINAISSAVVLLGRNPAQWELLHADPSLAPRAFSEVLRFESPLQYFTRVTTRDVNVSDDIVIPEGSRVLLSYGSANRDERHYNRADAFDITRGSADHLAFGVGRHVCAGMGLAKLEGEAILRALATEVSAIELRSEPELALNNAARGYAHVPVSLR